MSGDQSTPVVSPESDVSPKSQPTLKGDYFSLTRKQKPVAADDASRAPGASHGETKHLVAFRVGNHGKETDNTGDASATTPGFPRQCHFSGTPQPVATAGLEETARREPYPRRVATPSKRVHIFRCNPGRWSPEQFSVQWSLALAETAKV
ncbi:hypothetical protein GGR55DRAFT_245871 [Xylaria sp. FL0064]|nr:hypothetical protein GGR55DRAFT_245871 [Xylaria sp. FL0064]